jgi:hypothetical protein
MHRKLTSYVPILLAKARELAAGIDEQEFREGEAGAALPSSFIATP